MCWATPRGGVRPSRCSCGCRWQCGGQAEYRLREPCAPGVHSCWLLTQGPGGGRGRDAEPVSLESVRAGPASLLSREVGSPLLRGAALACAPPCCGRPWISSWGPVGAGLRVGSPAAPWLWGTLSLTGCVMPLGGAQAWGERSWGAGSRTAWEEVCVSGHTALPQFPLDFLQNLQKPRRAPAMLFCPCLGCGSAGRCGPWSPAHGGGALRKAFWKFLC